MRRMTLAFRPGDSFVLGLEGLEHVVGVILDNLIGDRVPFRPSFGPSFNVDRGHVSLPCSLRLPHDDPAEPSQRHSLVVSSQRVRPP